MIDAADVDLVAPHRWFCTKPGSPGSAAYAVRNTRGDGGPRKMHTLITGFLLTDHINGDGLDNRRANLRPANRTQNAANVRMHHDNHTGAKGVHLCKTTGRYRAQIREAGARRHLGRFDTLEEAARAYDAAAREAFGEFARTNEDA